MPSNIPGATNQLSPISWGTPVGLTSGLVLPSNPSRNGVVFVNNSVSSTIAIVPNISNIATTQGAYAAVPSTNTAAVINGPGSVTMQPGDKFILETLFATCQWNGVASTATGADLTILEF